MSGIQTTLTERRRLAIQALGRELDASNPSSAASQLRMLTNAPRPLAVSADVDGLVSATMAASVAPDWEVVAFVLQSQDILIHPSVQHKMPDDLVAIDLFSPGHDSISNHVVKFGGKKIQRRRLREAWRQWDETVNAAASQRLLAVPSIWAGTEGSYEDADRATSSKYKYPLGTAQILLALLESAGVSPRFYDRDYLPWLIASCDGGIASFTRHSYNARVWWPVMAGAVGPASLTEQVYRMVDGMRPHEFQDKVTSLDRERQARGEEPWLNDTWNLADRSISTLVTALRWLCDLTGWRDPVRGGLDAVHEWLRVPVDGWAHIYLSGTAAPCEADGVALLADAPTALNANFYMGGRGNGSRFNWIGGW